MLRVTVLIMITCACATSLAQSNHSARTSSAGNRNEDNPTPRNHQTAEDLLKALQSTRPSSEVILPESRIGKEPKVDRRTLFPEGAAVVGQRGTLVRQSDGWEFQSQGRLPIRLLPNAQLEIMIAMQADSPAMEYVASGEITLYEDRNYLLIKHAERGSSVPSPEAASAATPSGVAADASAEDVLSALQNQRPDGVGNLLDAARPEDRSGGVTIGGMIDGALVVRRSGRLLRDGGRWSFKFDDTSTGMPPLLPVLPNQSLEIMVHNADRGLGASVYVVSGETTQFENENFLLIRGVTRLPDTGNLRP